VFAKECRQEGRGKMTLEEEAPNGNLNHEMADDVDGAHEERQEGEKAKKARAVAKAKLQTNRP